MQRRVLFTTCSAGHKWSQGDSVELYDTAIEAAHIEDIGVEIYRVILEPFGTLEIVPVPEPTRIVEVGDAE